MESYSQTGKRQNMNDTKKKEILVIGSPKDEIIFTQPNEGGLLVERPDERSEQGTSTVEPATTCI